MPGPYNIPTAVPAGGDPPAEFNVARAAILDLDNRVGKSTGMMRLPATYGEWTVADVPRGGGYDFETLSAGRAEMCPFLVSQEDFRVDALATEIGATAIAGSIVRLGIYGCNAAGAPGPLVLDAGTASTATTGDKIITFSEILLPPNMYWLTQVPSDAIRVRRTGGTSYYDRILKGHGGSVYDFNGAGNTLHSTGWTATSPLPSTAILTSLNARLGDMPILAIRRAA